MPDREFLHLLADGTLTRQLARAKFRYDSRKMPGVAASVASLSHDYYCFHLADIIRL